MPFAHLQLQRLRRRRHQADFVTQVRVRNVDRDVLVGNRLERRVDRLQRPGDAADDGPGSGNAEAENKQADRQGLPDGGGNLRVEVIDLKARDDDHLPGLEGQGIAALAEEGIVGLAGLAGIEVCLPAAGAS